MTETCTLRRCICLWTGDSRTSELPFLRSEIRPDKRLVTHRRLGTPVAELPIAEGVRRVPSSKSLQVAVQLIGLSFCEWRAETATQVDTIHAAVRCAVAWYR
jgi:hypothetical protein